LEIHATGAKNLQIDEFIDRWKNSGGSERANFQTFANELCDALGVPRPAPATEAASTNPIALNIP